MSVPQNYLDRPVAVMGRAGPAHRVNVRHPRRLVRIHARNADRWTPAVDYIQRQRDELSESDPGCARVTVLSRGVQNRRNRESAKAGIDSESR